MRFAEPRLLWLLLLLPVTLWGAWAVGWARRGALTRFAGRRDLVPRFTAEASPHRRAAKTLLLLATLGCGVVAAARPQWGVRLEPVTRKGLDVAILLDTSSSMAAEDAAPRRLDQARHAAASLLSRLGADRVGVVTFAGHATLACPLTLDIEAARLVLDAADYEIEAAQGTALAGACRAALRLFAPRGAGTAAEARGRAVVLFTDGEDHEGDLDEALHELRRAGVKVLLVGCGTPRGAPIPERSTSGSLEGYKKDREGKIVTTRLEEDVLRRVALETGGRYFRATPAELEVETIAKEIQDMEAAEAGTLLRTRYAERFQIPLGLALASLLAEALVSDRRGARLLRLGGVGRSGTKPEASPGKEAAA